MPDMSPPAEAFTGTSPLDLLPSFLLAAEASLGADAVNDVSTASANI